MFELFIAGGLEIEDVGYATEDHDTNTVRNWGCTETFFSFFKSEIAILWRINDRESRLLQCYGTFIESKPSTKALQADRILRTGLTILL